MTGHKDRKLVEKGISKILELNIKQISPEREDFYPVIFKHLKLRKELDMNSN